MTKGIFPGTFDPITKGHLYLIEKASQLVDELHVVILNNLNKEKKVSVEDRIELIKKVTEGLNVKVTSFNGLTVHYAELEGCSFIFRGVRNKEDIEYENKMFLINNCLSPSISTVIIPATKELEMVSSSFVKELIANKKDISNYIPENILEDVLKLYS